MRNRALEALVQFATAQGDFDLESVSAGESDVGEWAGMAGTAPFLSERRTVVVRNVLKISDPDVAAAPHVDALRALPSTALLVLVVDSEPGDDARQRTLEGIGRKWTALVKKLGGEVLDLSVKPDQVRAKISEELAAAGKQLSPTGVSALIEMCGGSFSRCLEELEKLILFAGDSPTILEEDIRRLVVPAREWKVYSMIGATFDGNLTEALQQMRVLLGTHSKVADMAFSRIFPTIHRQLRLIWQARTLLEAKANLASVPDDVRAMMPSGSNLLSEQDWKQRQALRIAKRADFPALARCLELVAQADAELKGLGPSVFPAETLERMLIEMAAAVRTPARA